MLKSATTDSPLRQYSISRVFHRGIKLIRSQDFVDTMMDENNRKVIENLDEDKLLDMVRSEGRIAKGANSERVQKKLLDDLGLFDVNLNDFNLSNELENKVRYLKYVDVESSEQRELSENKKQEVRERMRELGFEPSDDN